MKKTIVSITLFFMGIGLVFLYAWSELHFILVIAIMSTFFFVHGWRSFKKTILPDMKELCSDIKPILPKVSLNLNFLRLVNKLGLW